MSLASIANKTLWLDTSDLSRMTVDSGGDPPTAADDQIYQFFDGSASALTLVAVNETTRRPFLRDNGSGQGELDFINSTAIRFLTATGSEATFNHILEGSGGIAMRLHCNAGLIAAGEVYLDCRGLSNGNKGWSLHRGSNEIPVFTVSNGTSAILTLTSSTAITDTNEHTFVIAIATGANACTMHQDGLLVATATITPTTGPAGFPLSLGVRSGTFDLTANSRIRNLLIKSVPLTAGDITAWTAYGPLLGDLSDTGGTQQSRIGIHLGIGL